MIPKMPQLKLTRREYELDRWIDNEDDEYEISIYGLDFVEGD